MTCRVPGKTVRLIVVFTFIAHQSGYGVEREPVKSIAAPTDKIEESGRDNAQEKIDLIVENGAKTPVPLLSTAFSEQEVNQLLRAQMKDFMSTGLSDPHVRLIGNNVLVARVTVDLDEYKRRREGRSGLGPLAILTGKLPVRARAVLHTRDGQGRFRLEASDVNGIPLPPALVREMITALSRSRRNPDGYDLEKPFALPANIRTVTIGHQEAVVTQ